MLPQPNTSCNDNPSPAITTTTTTIARRNPFYAYWEGPPSILEGSISTPSASEWSDLTMHDGAGTDEGDTFKYECTTCRITLPGLPGLMEHLREENDNHVVCKACFREFDCGDLRQEREAGLVKHLESVCESHCGFVACVDALSVCTWKAEAPGFQRRPSWS